MNSKMVEDLSQFVYPATQKALDPKMRVKQSVTFGKGKLGKHKNIF